MQNETIFEFLEFSLKYDDRALLKVGPGAKCPPVPLLAPLQGICMQYLLHITNFTKLFTLFHHYSHQQFV